jgi:hypothetical protein
MPGMAKVVLRRPPIGGPRLNQLESTLVDFDGTLQVCGEIPKPGEGVGLCDVCAGIDRFRTEADGLLKEWDGLVVLLQSVEVPPLAFEHGQIKCLVVQLGAELLEQGIGLCVRLEHAGGGASL